MRSMKKVLSIALLCLRLTAIAERPEPEKPGANPEFVDVGSKRADVVRVMGKPDRSTEFQSVSLETLYFGKSKIELFKGQVVGWKDEGELRVSVGEKAEDAAPVEVGSSADQVAVTMGTPKEIEFDRMTGRQTWRYGSSGIRIANGKVIDWTNFGNLFVGKLNREESRSVPVISSIPSSSPSTLPARPSATPPVQHAETYVAPSGSSGKSSGGGGVHVKGYTRKDGTYVPAHTRSRPRR